MEQSILLSISKDELEQLIKTSVTEVAKELIDKPTDNNSRLLTRKEAAQYLNIALSTLWEHTKNGILKSYGGVGKRIYYKTSELDVALRERLFIK